MGEQSNIEWTDHTFNPWIGCTKVSPGCTNCYAEAMAKFRGWAKWGKGETRQRTKTWGAPIKWNRDWQELNANLRLTDRPRVFCASLADWLDDEVPIEWLADLLKLIHDTPNLDWLLLTKRPENFFKRLGTVNHMDATGTLHFWLRPWLYGDAPRNVWLGTTVEDQQRADERIPALLKIPARVRFLSCEPLLEAVSLTHGFAGGPQAFPLGMGINWVICGGESGPKKRPFNCDWARSIRDQCKSADVAFFMKQIDKVQPIPDDLMIRQFPKVHGGTNG